jgi:Na+-driven multidrug efflux pump
MTSATISLVGTCIFRVVWIYTVFAMFENLEAIYVSYPISWFLTGAVFWVTVLWLLRRKMKETDLKRAGERLA